MILSSRMLKWVSGSGLALGTLLFVFTTSSHGQRFGQQFRLRPQMPGKPVIQPLAGNQPRAGEIEIEITQNLAACQRAGEVFEFIELARDAASTHNSTDRGADHNIGHDASRCQGADHPDVRPTARHPATQRQSNFEIAPCIAHEQ